MPLLVLMALKAACPQSARAYRIDELFHDTAADARPGPKAPHQKSPWFWFFRRLDKLLRAGRAAFSEELRRSARSTRRSPS